MVSLQIMGLLSPFLLRTWAWARRSCFSVIFSLEWLESSSTWNGLFPSNSLMQNEMALMLPHVLKGKKLMDPPPGLGYMRSKRNTSGELAFPFSWCRAAVLERGARVGSKALVSDPGSATLNRRVFILKMKIETTPGCSEGAFTSKVLLLGFQQNRTHMRIYLKQKFHETYHGQFTLMFSFLFLSFISFLVKILIVAH